MSRALAHFGGYQTINAVVYTAHARRFTRLLERANAQFSVNLIPVSNIGPDTAVLLHEKIDRGELLVIVGDRTPPGENGRVTRVPFLGSEAPFAVGPFILAALLGCPVYLFFCLREGNAYRVHLERFADRLDLPRQAREEVLRDYAQRYASRLESYCIRAPLQWFNFYDFWGAPSTTTKNDRVKTPHHEFDHTKPRRV
jgi:predicted LPLAT superfamily acyltransferase